jgi:hypothetical protein
VRPPGIHKIAVAYVGVRWPDWALGASPNTISALRN